VDCTPKHRGGKERGGKSYLGEKGGSANPGRTDVAQGKSHERLRGTGLKIGRFGTIEFSKHRRNDGVKKNTKREPPPDREL